MLIVKESSSFFCSYPIITIPTWAKYSCRHRQLSPFSCHETYPGSHQGSGLQYSVFLMLVQKSFDCCCVPGSVGAIGGVFGCTA